MKLKKKKRKNNKGGGSIFVVFVGSPPPKFTSSTKTSFERETFLTKTENQPIHEITSPPISKKPTIHENWPSQI